MFWCDFSSWANPGHADPQDEESVAVGDLWLTRNRVDLVGAGGG